METEYNTKMQSTKTYAMLVAFLSSIEFWSMYFVTCYRKRDSLGGLSNNGHNDI
jgi:hypothetical protein